jgi:hypothetical protein
MPHYDIDREFLCFVCGEPLVDESEIDDEGVYWTYCAECDEWTDHPPDG